MRRAYVVQGLGFGDEGKGSIVDFLVRNTGADMVVRFGGAQNCGHNVVTPNGLHHCFAQLGSGSFVPGVSTYLSRFMMIEPLSFMNELEEFEREARFRPKVYVERGCPVITPWHWRINRLRELLRVERHGSTGMGVGELRQDIEYCRQTIMAGDLLSPGPLELKLLEIQHSKLYTLLELFDKVQRNKPDLVTDYTTIDPFGLRDRYYEFLKCVEIVPNGSLERLAGDTTVFEGHQGVLLDEVCGLEPHRTWSNCTFGNANKLLEKIDCQKIRIGVTRTFHTRHGAGPLPSELPPGAPICNDEHNMTGEWQGKFRYAPLDIPLFLHAIRSIGKMDGIAVNHIDKCGPDGIIPMVHRDVSNGNLWSGGGNVVKARWTGLTIAAGPILIESRGPTYADKTFSEDYHHLYGVSALSSRQAVARESD